MKKLVLILLVLVLGLCACAEEPKSEEALPETEKDQPIEKIYISADEPKVTMHAEAVTEKGCTVFIETDYTDGEITTGSMFYLKKDGEKLKTVIPDEEIAWTMEAYLIAPDTVCSIIQNWEYLYGSLPDGEYEIVKQVYIELPNGERGIKEISAEFGFATVYD